MATNSTAFAFSLDIPAESQPADIADFLDHYNALREQAMKTESPDCFAEFSGIILRRIGDKINVHNDINGNIDAAIKLAREFLDFYDSDFGLHLTWSEIGPLNIAGSCGGGAAIVTRHGVFDQVHTAYLLRDDAAESGIYLLN